jgi:hypothetical protein
MFARMCAVPAVHESRRCNRRQTNRPSYFTGKPLNVVLTDKALYVLKPVCYFMNHHAEQGEKKIYVLPTSAFVCFESILEQKNHFVTR